MFTESYRDAWVQRFGTEPRAEFPELAPFLRHRSVRRYNSEPISEELMAALIGIAQSAATSSNLQLWSVISVQDPERRNTISKLCGDQQQIRDAAWFLGFFVDHYRIRKAANEVGEKAEGLDYLEFFAMAVIDAALAAERLVAAAESLGIGICYIGALRNDVHGIKDLLKLPEGVFGAFGLCLGWPEEPVTAEIKPRLSQPAVWFREQYDTNVDTPEYDERMKEFYVSQRMKGEVTWSMRSGRRVGLKQLSGREVLKPWLEEQGFNKR